MSLPAPYSEVYLEGDGVTTEFAFGTNFKPISAGLVKCIVYLEDGYEVVPTYTVNMAVGSITISALTMPDSTVLTAPPLGSTVRIFRDVPEAQTVNASQIQTYTGKQLEIVFDAIVAMIQEVSYTVDHKTVRLTEPQRDIALQELSELADNYLIYWDFTNRKLVVTNYPQQDVVRCVNGLFFRIKTDPNTLNPYLEWSTDNSDWHAINVDAAYALAQDAYNLADSAYNLASTTRGELNAHKALRNNPHETSMANLIDTDFNNLVGGQFLQFNGLNWVNVNYSAVYAWGGIIGDITDQADLQAALNTKVTKTGDQMEGTFWLKGYLNLRNQNQTNSLCWCAGSNNNRYKWALNNNINSVGFQYDGNLRAIMPLLTGGENLGHGNFKWNGVYAAKLNNGGDLAVPANTTGTLATKADVDLAANSGRMITDQGVWFAKMYAATVVPTGAEYDGKNYADFSQVDADNNPVIKIYTGASGAWTLSETITPPAEYDGYVPVTSKIWDIAEQTGQQGGRVMWNHQSKEFTPYPLIISFDNQNITNSSLADCTVTMPYNIAANSAVNAGWVINRQGWQDTSDETWAATMTIELSDDKSLYFVDATANTTITIDASGISVAAGNAKTFEIHVVGTGTPTITWNGIDAWLVDSETTPVEANKTSIFVVRVQQRPSDANPTVVANYGGAY